MNMLIAVMQKICAGVCWLIERLACSVFGVDELGGLGEGECCFVFVFDMEQDDMASVALGVVEQRL